MNAAHLHLLINHLPIFASILALLVAVYACFALSTPHILRLAALLLCSAAFGAAIAMRTGEDAEEIIEPMEHVESTAIHTHSDDAHNAAPVAMGAAFFGIIAVICDRRGTYRRAWAFCLVIASCLSTGLMARTGYSGGQINHREAHADFDPQAPVTEQAPLDL